jgi:hypothetical protein
VIPRIRVFIVLAASACVASGLLAGPASAVGLGSAAWSPVAATGPTVIPPQQNEVQKLFVDAEGGEYTLTARHLSAIGIGDLGSGSQTVSGVIAASGTFSVGQTIEGFTIPPGTTITAVGSGTLTLSQAAGGGEGGTNRQVSITAYDAPATTADLPYDSTASEVQTALEGLAPIGGGNVTVSGGPGNHNAENPYVIVFSGALADTNVAQLTPSSSALVNGAANTLTALPGGQGTSKLELLVQNIGGAESSGLLTYRAVLPSGFTMIGSPITGAPGSGSGAPEVWSCGSSTTTEILCTRGASVRPGLVPPPIDVTITTAPGTKGGVVRMEAFGGGAPPVPATAELPVTVSAIPAQPGIQSFVAGAYDENGNFFRRAGGHPYSASAAIFAKTVRSPRGFVIPAGEFKDITVELPPGFLGNPIAVPQCPESTPIPNCSLDTMVAVVEPFISSFGREGDTNAVFNTKAPFGYPAKFRFDIAGVEALNVVGSLRSDEDYGIDTASLNTPQIEQVYGTFFTFWGEPAAHSHDETRCREIVHETGCEASNASNTALLTNATNCSEQALIAASNNGVIYTGLNTTLWQNPGEIFRSKVGIPPIDECDQLHFKAHFTFEPSDTKSDSPASFRTSLTVPSEGLTDPTKLTTPEIRKTVVQLPKGVVLNASGADGLEACSEAQIGLKNKIDPATGLPVPLAMPNPIRFTKDPNTCPEASKVGTLDLKTPLLEDTLHGNLYLAAQGNGNPFGSLFAIYLVIEDPRHGIFIKLPGRVDPDPVSGQMTVSFDNLPQLPFTSLDLNLKGGNRAALANPTTCGTYTTTAINTPWSAPESGPPTESSNGFDINQSPNGGPCAKTPQDRPFDLGWSAGSSNTTAGAPSPVSLRVTRPDGAQELDSLELTTPPGLTASLKGIPYCTATNAQIEARTGKEEQASPTCPAASQVGTTLTGAGSGPTPFFTPGKLYLAGPYKGAPLSVVAVTPAVAGPFDLGNVVVRSAVYVNPETAQITAKTDPIPQVLDGVVLRIRDVRINLDRKDWTLNPTSCEPLSIDLTAHGNSGATANLKTRFQVGGCDKLAFGPKMALKLKGGTKRNDNPALTATLSYPEGPGYANTRSVAVTLPHSEFLDQSHIRTVCTRVQFAAKACPQGSIYGRATAITPLLDQPLTGPVYLRSSDNKLPDLVIALKGPPSQPIEVVLDGRIDSIRGGIRNSFELVPDAPVSKFTLEMQGGKKGLLVNSRNLCTAPSRATVRLIAQNNKRADQFPPMQSQCGKQHKGPRKHGRRSRQRSWLSKLVAGW